MWGIVLLTLTRLPVKNRGRRRREVENGVAVIGRFLKGGKKRQNWVSRERKARMCVC